MRVALGVSYRGQAYRGWQSQPDHRTVQDALERGLVQFAALDIRTVFAVRTETGLRGLKQVVLFDTEAEREPFSWVRGVNRYLPPDIAIQWSAFPGPDFHARNHARGRRYAYLLLESAVRPAIESGAAGWVFRPLDGAAMRAAVDVLLGEHDFSSFRSSECQAASPVKTLRAIAISKRGAYWRFEFDASAFLHHMVRNIMGCLLAVRTATRSVDWLGEGPA